MNTQAQLRKCGPGRRGYRWIAVTSALVLSACGVDSDVVQTANFIIQSVDRTVPKVTRDAAAAVPYATMGVELGDSAEVLVVLGSAVSDDLDWYAGDQVFIRTRRGRIVRTAGLPYDLGGLQSLPAGADESRNAGQASFALDYPDLGIFSAPALCTRKDAGDENVEILGAQIATRHVVEHCEVTALRWHFDNDFWQDRMSGYIWRSRQYIHPKSPPLTLEVLRPEQRGPG